MIGKPAIDGPTTHRTSADSNPESPTGSILTPVRAVDLLEHQLRRMAFSLHDGPVQTLSAAGAMLERTSRSDRLDSLRAQIAAAEGLIDYAMLEMREIMRELRPAALDEESLIAKISELAANYQERWETPVDLKVLGTESALGLHVQVSLFRVVQEALSNVRKHANARHIQIEIGFAADAVSCTVRDDGTGFDPDRASVLGTMSHWGLVGMKERMLLICGELTVTSEAGEGTEVRARVPWGPE